MSQAMLINQTTGDTLTRQVVLCDTFWRKLKGLMFKRALPADCAYVFVYERESVADVSIHMFFVPFSIAVIWLDRERRVVEGALDEQAERQLFRHTGVWWFDSFQRLPII